MKGSAVRKYLEPAAISAAIIAAVFFYYVNSWKSMGDFVTAIDHCDLLFCDFVNHYYPTGRAVFASAIPEPHYVYSSFFACFLGLYGMLSPHTSLWLWGAFEIVTTFLLFLVPAIIFFRRSKPHYYLYLLLFACSFPVLHNFKWGQISVFMTLCVLGTLYLYRNDRKFLAAFLLALGVAVKYYIGIFAIYFILRKDLRFVATFLVWTLVFLVLIPFLVMGVDGAITFNRLVIQNIANIRRTWVLEDSNSQYFASVISRLVHVGGGPIDRTVLRTVGYLIFGMNILALYGLTRIRPEDEIYWAFALLFVSLPFIIETSWPHYFVYLPFCQVFADFGLERDKSVAPKLLKRVLLLLPSMVLASSVFFNLVGNWQSYGYYGFLFIANALLLLLIYVQTVSFARARTRSVTSG